MTLVILITARRTTFAVGGAALTGYFVLPRWAVEAIIFFFIILIFAVWAVPAVISFVVAAGRRCTLTPQHLFEILGAASLGALLEERAKGSRIGELFQGIVLQLLLRAGVVVQGLDDGIRLETKDKRQPREDVEATHVGRES